VHDQRGGVPGRDRRSRAVRFLVSFIAVRGVTDPEPLGTPLAGRLGHSFGARPERLR
jgi:hypothetical protein